MLRHNVGSKLLPLIVMLTLLYTHVEQLQQEAVH
jgi:hypothetical protein